MPANIELVSISGTPLKSCFLLFVSFSVCSAPETAAAGGDTEAEAAVPPPPLPLPKPAKPAPQQAPEQAPVPQYLPDGF